MYSLRISPEKNSVRSLRKFLQSSWEEIIECQEFYFWFSRFEKGMAEFDENIKYEKDINWKKPKILSFSDIPISVIHVILDHVKPVERLVLQKVSQKLRSMLLSRNHGFKWIELHVDINKAWLMLEEENIRVDYTLLHFDTCVSFEQRSGSIDGEDFVTVALNDAAPFMLNPKYPLNDFQVKNDCRGWAQDDDISYGTTQRLKIAVSSKIERAFNSFNAEFHVKSLLIDIIGVKNTS